MTDKMKCPFCGMKLQTRKLLTGMADYVCINNQCGFSYTPLPAKWWQALIDGKKAQDTSSMVIDKIDRALIGNHFDEKDYVRKTLEDLKSSITTRGK